VAGGRQERQPGVSNPLTIRRSAAVLGGCRECVAPTCEGKMPSRQLARSALSLPKGCRRYNDRSEYYEREGAICQAF
jgi:hypothetical protein